MGCFLLLRGSCPSPFLRPEDSPEREVLTQPCSWDLGMAAAPHDRAGLGLLDYSPPPPRPHLPASFPPLWPQRPLMSPLPLGRAGRKGHQLLMEVKAAWNCIPHNPSLSMFLSLCSQKAGSLWGWRPA